MIDCQRCASKGWVNKGLIAGSTATNGVYDPPPVVTGPTIDWQDDDPTVRSLRERGFLVVPPANTAA